MFSGRLLIIALMAATFSVFSMAMLNPLRPYIARKCDDIQEIPDTSICKHGADNNNNCGKLACLKGIGELCDSDNDILLYGKCAKSLLCCNRCIGCRKGKCDPTLCSFTPVMRQNSIGFPFSLNMPNYEYDQFSM